MISLDNVMTLNKNRLVAQNGQQICRWDNEVIYDCNSPLKKLISNVQKDDVVVVSDYAKGVIQESAVSSIEAKVIVDPKQDVSFYKGAYLIKPNMQEMKIGLENFLMIKHIFKWKNIIGSGLLLQMVQREYMLLMKIKNIDIFMRKTEKLSM